MENKPEQSVERPITDRQKLDLLVAIEEVTGRKGFDYENGDAHDLVVPASQIPKAVRVLFPLSIDPSQNTSYQVYIIRHARKFIPEKIGIVASVIFVQVHTGGPYISNTHSLAYEITRNDADELDANRYFRSTTYDKEQARETYLEMDDLSMEEIFENADSVYREARQIKIDEQNIGITRVSEIEADQLIGFIKGR